MQHNKNNPDEGQNPNRNTETKEPPGFFTTLVKVGQSIYIGDSVVIFKEMKQNGVIVCIKAPASEKIVKKLGD